MCIVVEKNKKQVMVLQGVAVGLQSGGSVVAQRSRPATEGTGHHISSCNCSGGVKD